MMGTLGKYTPDKPCRCGYDGEGAHQCHAGRHPDYPRKVLGGPWGALGGLNTCSVFKLRQGLNTCSVSG